MSAEPQDVSTTLDAIEEVLDLRHVDADALLPNLATLLLSLQGDSPFRPRVHRLLGVLQSQLNLYGDALRELGEARALAERAQPPNFLELAKARRETAAIYAARGDTSRATAELISALASAALEGDDREIGRIVADLGCVRLEARRFDEAAMLLRQLVSKGPHSQLLPSEARRVRLHLCHALNRAGAYEEALQHVATLQAGLPEEETSIRCLAWLEESRAQTGLGKLDDAEKALHEAESLLPAKDSAYERSDFIQAVAELQEAKGGPSAVKALESLIAHDGKQRFVVREMVAFRALASALFERGEEDAARAALGKGLRSALQANLVEAADDIRVCLLKSADAEHLEHLSETVDLIGGDSAGERRFVRLDRIDRRGADKVFVDLADGSYVTLKEIAFSEITESQCQAAMDTVRREYAAAGRISDSRVAPILDLRVRPGGALYVVQRHVSGPTLREFYSSGAGPEQLLEILASVADALTVLHEKGIAHRDLTPDTIVVVRDAKGLDRPILVGLGVARVAAEKESLRHAGTPPYVAPEQRLGEPGDGRADIYALGQMIAEIWGGAVPGPPPTGFGRLWHRGAQGEAMPRAIGDIVRDMLAPDPSRRTGDLSYVAEALRSQRRQKA
jgi:serine/threonine-protein kinase